MSGRPAGALVELVEAVCGLWRIELDARAFATRAALLAARDAWDVAGLEPDAADGLRDSAPWAVWQGAVLLRPDAAPGTDRPVCVEVLDRPGTLVLVARSSPLDMILTSLFRHARLLRHALQADALDAFARGEGTAVAADRATLRRRFARKADHMLMTDRALCLPQVLAVAADRADLLAAVNEALIRLQADARLARILTALVPLGFEAPGQD